jgi:ribosomal 30S subunit maturation factor RimM
VLEVQEDGSTGDPMMIPFVKAFFTGIDIAAKTAVANLPPGLTELNRR